MNKLFLYTEMKNKTIFSMLVLLAIFFSACSKPTQQVPDTKTVNSFEDCINAGGFLSVGAIPVTCEMPDGKKFVPDAQPEKSGLYNYPDEPLEQIPPILISAKYLVEHRSALNEQVVTLQGVVVETLLGEEACPADKGMCAQPRIFLADSSNEDRDKNYDVMVLVSEDETGYKVGDNAEIKGTVYSSKTSAFLDKGTLDVFNPISVSAH